VDELSVFTWERGRVMGICSCLGFRTVGGLRDVKTKEEAMVILGEKLQVDTNKKVSKVLGAIKCGVSDGPSVEESCYVETSANWRHAEADLLRREWRSS
jgi:hypothetical protein